MGLASVYMYTSRTGVTARLNEYGMFLLTMEVYGRTRFIQKPVPLCPRILKALKVILEYLKDVRDNLTKIHDIL